MTQILSTDSVAPGERVAYWQEMVCQTFVQAHCDSPIGDAFRGRLVTETFDQADISRIDAGQQRIHRRPVDIARAAKPRFYLCYHLAGQARYRERNSEVLIGPGEMILLDNCEPYTAEYREPVSSMVLHVPHQLVRDRFRLPERLLGHRIGEARGMTRIAGEFLQSCITQAEYLTPSQRTAMADMAINLVCGVLAEELGTRPEIGTHQAVLLARIKQHIDAHLGDPALAPEQVAAAMGISVRYLARLFQLDGLSFGRYLRQQRIEQCRQALGNPAWAARRIGEVAFDHGFNNLAHFCRVFREELGCSPSDYRDQVAGR